ncbi:nucleoside phosphorylase [Gillisia limnaea]|uniref:Uridine phosphorylase n=1 Tax=Gillisia limnaea (strain DSM 15749 / LMG 21470 / R-8282) TaxID=865937 RepID=H2BZ98_GILLR|nr:nucleoside phosphorylase [Gillisia limnaea]EHQ01227.1 purine or other phosphorylase family 1 [Gillisia limnaea DSM 15749]
MTLPASEFIQNKDGSVYHLNLLPQHLANTVITVGDPERVNAVTRYFDKIEFKVQKREFHTQTGTYQGKRITVISTGIGTGNIDIVLNELDALVNIDFKSLSVKKELTSLDIIRIGTSGSIQEEIPLDSFLLSESAIGFDALLHFYECNHILEKEFSEALTRHLKWPKENPDPYVVNVDKELALKFNEGFHRGVTLTNCGFYGPQGRVLRLKVKDAQLNEKLHDFNYLGKKITNLEMETSAIYGLSKLMGHRAVSLNAIVANRATKEFSKDPKKTVDKLIQLALRQIVA